MTKDAQGRLNVVSRESRTRGLVKIVNESKGERGDPNQLNFTERRFLLKHPDWVREVFSGKRSHVRANKIVMKMLMLDLNLDDFDEVYEALKQRKR